MTRVFTGADDYLKGEPAMVYAVAGTSKVIARFHNADLRRGRHHYGYGWHIFDATDFTEPKELTHDT